MFKMDSVGLYLIYLEDFFFIPECPDNIWKWGGGIWNCEYVYWGNYNPLYYWTKMATEVYTHTGDWACRARWGFIISRSVVCYNYEQRNIQKRKQLSPLVRSMINGLYEMYDNFCWNLKITMFLYNSLPYSCYLHFCIHIHATQLYVEKKDQTFLKHSNTGVFKLFSWPPKFLHQNLTRPKQKQMVTYQS